MKSFSPVFWAGLLPALLAAACAREVQAPEAAPQKVKAVTVVSETLTPRLQSFGSLAFQNKADIATTVEGTIKKINFKEGDVVRTGDVLAVLENIQLQIQKTQAEKELSAAKASLELSQAKFWEARLQFETRRISLTKTENEIRQKKLELDEEERNLNNKEQLLDVGGISQQELTALKVRFSAAQTEYQALLAGFESQKIGLRDQDILSFGLRVPGDEKTKRQVLEQINTTIPAAEIKVAQASVDKSNGSLTSVNQLLGELTLRSPIDGILGARYLEPGERATQGTKILTVFNSQSVNAVFPIQESDAAHLKKDMEVKIWIDALGPDPRSGKIDIISPLVDPQSGNITVKALLANKDKDLRPGMFIRVALDYGQSRQALLVPITAISQKKSNTGKVYAIVNRHLFERKVKLGQEQKDKIEILEGLNAGDQIVDSPSPLLKEGDSVASE